MKKIFSIILTILILSLAYPSMVTASPGWETLRPNAAGDSTEFSPYPGTGEANWQDVDDITQDDGTTYVAGYLDKKDFYNIADTALSELNVINNVTLYVWAKYYNVAYYKGYCGIKSGTTESWSSQTELDGSWTRYSKVYSTDPNTGAAWTVAALDTLQVGVKTAAVDGGMQCTQIFVEVSYTPFTLPTVTTQAATSVDDVSATGNGNITNKGGENCDYRGFAWDTSSHTDPGDVVPPATYSDNATESGSFTTGAFTGSITGLTPGTVYYYRAYAHNSMGWSYGEEVSFITHTTPTITVDAATNVAYTTARLNSTLTSDGGESCEVRFQYNTTDNWTLADYTDNTTWTADYTTGQHPYADIDGLTHNTLYYFRAQANNAYGTSNSTSTSFTTSNAVLNPTSFKAFSEATSVALLWTKGTGSTDTHVRYKEGTYPTTITDGIQVYLGTLGSYTHSDLTSGHTYYYSAWGKSGTTYSDNYTTVMATTLATSAAGGELETPSAPSRWFQIPDPTVFSNMPGYNVVNAFIDALDMPRASGWFALAIFSCLAFGLVIGMFSKHALPAMIAIAFAMTVLSLAKLLPMFMIAFAVMFMVGAFQMGRTR